MRIDLISEGLFMKAFLTSTARHILPQGFWHCSCTWIFAKRSNNWWMLKLVNTFSCWSGSSSRWTLRGYNSDCVSGQPQIVPLMAACKEVSYLSPWWCSWKGSSHFWGGSPPRQKHDIFKLQGSQCKASSFPAWRPCRVSEGWWSHQSQARQVSLRLPSNLPLFWFFGFLSELQDFRSTATLAWYPWPCMMGLSTEMSQTEATKREEQKTLESGQ